MEQTAFSFKHIIVSKAVILSLESEYKANGAVLRFPT